jgi:lipoyl(octanoyl) transferase
MVQRRLGRVAYEPTWRAMQAFNAARTSETPDQLWLVEHPPVFTLGLAGKREHLLAPGDIPVVSTDRGGQVTYHGPGQVVAYPLLDLRRAGYGVRELVRRLEGALIDVLEGYGIRGERKSGMPGVYVGDSKIAAIGLRVARGCTYHGVALNVDMDLEPFSRINPCGYAGLAATSLAAQGAGDKIDAVQQRLGDAIVRHTREGGCPSS